MEYSHKREDQCLSDCHSRTYGQVHRPCMWCLPQRLRVDETGRAGLSGRSLAVIVSGTCGEEFEIVLGYLFHLRRPLVSARGHSDCCVLLEFPPFH
uniref:uncharacterized protein LOC100386634 n=1 Tax=Callithrix jacchus TaxID=9483 RepID=UPI0023DCF445|nr:uncharacterized protein LOC100386634 [Callithrix jacchus]